MATIIRIGGDPPGIMNEAAEYIGSFSSEISNSKGEGYVAPVHGTYERPRQSIGVPMPEPEAENDPIPFVANMVRLAVIEVWGHHYGYYDALRYNDLDEAHVLRKGQIYYVPARGSRALLTRAAKWRERFGST